MAYARQIKSDNTNLRTPQNTDVHLGAILQELATRGDLSLPDKKLKQPLSLEEEMEKERKVLHDLANKVAFRLGISGKDLNTHYVKSPGGKRVSDMTLTDMRHKKAWLVNLMASEYNQNDTTH